ncbi:hypothetical protein I3842_08G032900 [Carya illinoinensis]|uniref:CW-type domain-containing protein n=1 Tax=Carya illinoinensis TaxID=32201 RepID=A0A922JA71_CARIL|nr:hypothetical protein I3842_08G032900 [Carya illinoinensis]
MLMQSSVPSSNGAALHFSSDHGKEDTLCDWRPGTEIWQMCSNCDKYPHGHCKKAKPIIEEKENANTPSSLNFPRSYAQPPNLSTISESFNAKKSADSDSRSFTNFDAPSVAAKKQHVVFQVEHESHTVGAPIKASGAAIKNGRRKILEVDSANDNCSSSESNMELVSASMMTEVDDTGECSSSSVMVMEVKGEDLSENDLCISILRCQGLVEVLPTKNDDSAEHAGPSSGSSCSRSCKICGHTDTTLNMLICDNCEDAFHICKIPMETGTRRSLSIACEMGRCRNTLAKGDLNPIALMLRDTESYTMGVQVGKGFQAEVPDYDVDAIGEPVEMNPSECVTSHEWNFNKLYTPNSISNWIQCREVIDGIGEGINGTICGKWRRAPLREVQTDDWDCFRSVLWDPFHADCAELETDQVIKQLKYVQMLRPQLAAKRRKSDHRKKKK